MKSVWGNKLTGLKQAYKNENTGEVTTIKLTKEELQKYLDDLDKKNNYKTRFIR